MSTDYEHLLIAFACARRDTSEAALDILRRAQAAARTSNTEKKNG